MTDHKIPRTRWGTRPQPWGADPNAPWGRDDKGQPLLPEEPWSAPDAGAPWGRGQDGKPFLPNDPYAHWTDIPELFDRRVAEIQARVDNANRGPWYIENNSHVTGQPHPMVCAVDHRHGKIVGRIETHRPADFELIRHAEPDLEWCLDMIAKLRAHLAAADATIAALGGTDSDK
ncbi:hypothetical protein ABH931_002781 [Streptacidiphilus sp. MAP12-33]|uniref:hypothetical protein n=1 Tax=Streptacidiphilus sp. MAP12-33 TaxID=3156266 RepID=UPI00351892B9